MKRMPSMLLLPDGSMKVEDGLKSRPVTEGTVQLYDTLLLDFLFFLSLKLSEL